MLIGMNLAEMSIQFGCKLKPVSEDTFTYYKRAKLETYDAIL